MPLLLTWINFKIHYKVWGEITCPLPNSIGAVWEWINKFHPTLYRACDYLSTLWLKLIHVSEKGLVRLFAPVTIYMNLWAESGTWLYYWPALCAGLLCCNFFGQPGSVSKFPPLLWVKLWVGWVGRGYTEISRYFPASWINWVTLVTKIKLLYSLRF